MAEKSLKGFLVWHLVWHDVPFRKTHILVEIGQQCATVDPTLETLLPRAAGLMEYAWKFRYPGGPEQLSIPEAQETLDRGVYETILSRLPKDVRS